VRSRAIGRSPITGYARANAASRVSAVGGRHTSRPDQYEAIRAEQAIEDLEQIARLRELADRLPPAVGPYSGGGSFYADLLRANDGDFEARRQLGEQTRRAGALAEVELRASPWSAHVPPGLVEHRAASSSTLAGMVPDGWAISGAGGLPRTNRPLLDAALADGAEFPLTPTGDRVTLVASTTQSLTASSPAENAPVTQTDVQISVGNAVQQAMRVGSDIRGVPTRIVAWHPRRLLWMGAKRTDTSLMDDVFHNMAEEGQIVQVQSGALLSSTIGSQDKVITLNGADVRYGEEPALRAYVDQSSSAGALGIRIYGLRYYAQSFLYPTQIGCASGSGLVAPPSFS
jgi:hypothetical protein